MLILNDINDLLILKPEIRFKLLVKKEPPDQTSTNQSMSIHLYTLDKFMVLKETAGGSKWQFLSDLNLVFKINEDPKSIQVTIQKKGKVADLV